MQLLNQGCIARKSCPPLSGETVTRFSEPTWVASFVTVVHGPAVRLVVWHRRRVGCQTGQATSALLGLDGEIRTAGA